MGLPDGTTSGTTNGGYMTPRAVSRCYVSTPPRTRTGNLLIKRTLHTYAHARRCAPYKGYRESRPVHGRHEIPPKRTPKARHEARHAPHPDLIPGQPQRVG